MATERFSCFAIAAPGLEELVARELTALGEQPRPEDGGVAWEGDARSVMRANLWLRTASRVVVRIARFRATAFYELEKQAKRIPWERYVAKGMNAEFRVTARKSKLYHSDAIAERLRKATGSRAGEGEGSTQRFVVRVVRDEFEISADTSGELLYMRGYRLATAKAPLRETLASAILLGAGWDGSSALLDPFCGSGTIPIEAALIAQGIAPGIARDFSFAHWHGFDESAWRALLDDARRAQRPSAGIAILGSDRDAGAIEASLANSERAGVAGSIEFSQRAISAVAAPAERGLIATNPPYGKRVGDRDVRNLYAQFGKTVRARFPGWNVALLLPSAQWTTQFGLELDPVFQTVNGGIPVGLHLGDGTQR